jgi:hypothetical protein
VRIETPDHERGIPRQVKEKTVERTVESELPQGRGESLVAQLDSAVSQVEQLRDQQVQQQYSDQLGVYVQEKAEQIERLQSSLAAALTLEQAQLQAIQQRAPGWTTGKKAHAQWEQQVARRKTRIAQLTQRLDRVGEIEEAGVYAETKIEELAERKLTDVDLHPRPRLTTVEGWTELASQAPLTAARISAYAYRLVALPRLVAAESGRLDRLWADGWAAVGDAAMTLDPLSSHGLTVAMLSGRDLAQAVAQHFGGDREALSSYGTCLTVAFSQYETIRLTYYRAERRWLTSTYWQRRQRVEKTVRSQLLDRMFH